MRTAALRDEIGRQKDKRRYFLSLRNRTEGFAARGQTCRSSVNSAWKDIGNFYMRLRKKFSAAVSLFVRTITIVGAQEFSR
jgi:hypothetical protein